MPNYTYFNSQTEELEIHSMPISELESFREKNPHLEQRITLIPLADPTRLGLRKPDSGFRDALKHVKRSHYKSNVNDW
jgi:hypothetical protein